MSLQSGQPLQDGPSRRRGSGSSWVWFLAFGIVTVLALLSAVFLPLKRQRPLPTVVARTRQADGMVMVLVPAGPFLMGSTRNPPSVEGNETPRHSVTLDAFWIDRTEVSNDQYRSFVKATGHLPPDCTIDPHYPTYKDTSMGDYPVACVAWQDAADYCRWAGGRLPTEAEWEKAARGTDGRTYPWGNLWPTCSRANFDDCCADEALPVGGRPAGVSPYGTLDMAGNVEEWVNDWFADDYYSSSPSGNPQGPYAGTAKVARGGDWILGSTSVRTAARAPRGLTVEWTNIGFRCVVPGASLP